MSRMSRPTAVAARGAHFASELCVANFASHYVKTLFAGRNFGRSPSICSGSEILGMLRATVSPADRGVRIKETV
jgi:hypothetical protein